MGGLTLPHLASEQGHLDLAWFLVEHSTNMEAQATPRIQQYTTI